MGFFLQFIAEQPVATFLAAVALCLIGALTNHALKVSAEIRAERRKENTQQRKRLAEKKKRKRKRVD